MELSEYTLTDDVLQKIEDFKERRIKAKELFLIRRIEKNVAYNFIKKYHYLGDAKFFSEYNYGLYLRVGNDDYSSVLCGCSTFSPPQGTVSMLGWFGIEDNGCSEVMELSRLCMFPILNKSNATSYLLGNSMKMLRKDNPKLRAIITLANSTRHIGSIYQVCNFKYYGMTKGASDFHRDDGVVNPRGKTGSFHGVYVPRDKKHRYAYIFDESLKCNYKEEPRPANVDDLTYTECCDGNLVLYDNRYDEYYTCPKCCREMVHISKDEYYNVLDMKKTLPHEQFVQRVSDIVDEKSPMSVENSNFSKFSLDDLI